MAKLVIFFSFFGGVVPKPPLFDQDYSIKGVIVLPYAEIKETFTAYYDISHQRSRVDYYGDLVLTVQRADLAEHANGINYKIAYMVDNEGNPERVCFQTEGSSEAPVVPQALLPDISTFALISNETKCPSPDYFPRLNGQGCELWKYTVVNGAKKNEYSFWLQRGPEGEPLPVLYEMMGYDSLLGSHYDQYQLFYHGYQAGQQEESLFEVSKNYTCRSFPGPGVEHVAIHNPIKEFVHHYEQHLDNDFENFLIKHGKNYNFSHRELRKTFFRHNYRFIQSMNRKNLHYKLKVNHLADYSPEEMAMLRGRRVSKGYNGGLPFTEYPWTKVPDNWDWRLLGAVNPVKDQAVCGSCWSFGTTGTIEGVYFVRTGQLVSLSEQQLIDCSWNEGDNGCDGGEDFRAYDYIMKVGGIATEEDYGYYLGQDGKCHDKEVPKTVKLRGFVNVTSGSPRALKVALYKNGPVTVGIDASHRSLSFYANGIYYEPKCGNKPDDLDHQVLVVGYGTLFGQNYWLIKNSWSTYWGNDGYVLISQKNNNCGVTTQPTYPLIE
ncbi:hypothetical protein B4U79_09624 [Dinothrombium tinctorium]|uniref:Counting factor associated protein D-like protein n=1 Tax=Dinothrombium tinctorium TaxID=1965070 RepID=A0A443QZ52_9ACAR|nr:hypothetical protein B4U79_09624 [Dinothrombium tinctorium]